MKCCECGFRNLITKCAYKKWKIINTPITNTNAFCNMYYRTGGINCYNNSQKAIYVIKLK